MYYGEIKNCDIANGEGVRVTLFVTGCRHHCKNCNTRHIYKRLIFFSGRFFV